MENNYNIPIQEPRSSELSFISHSILKEHVIKHVIEAPDERWINVFDPDLVARVRDTYLESDSLSKSDDFRKLTSLYARLASQTIVQCCSKGINHIHQLEDVYTVESQIVKCINRYQKIQAYSKEDKVVVIATLKINQNQTSLNCSSQQKEGQTETQDYVIVTMYRPEKKLLKKQSFQSWFNDRIERGNPMHPYETLLADHR